MSPIARPPLRRALLAGLLRLAFVALLPLASCATTATPTALAASADDGARVDDLLRLVRQRLEVAPEVARVKWNTHAPIEDLARERQIVDGVAQAASAHGLDPALAGRFFQAQIDAGKLVQRALHAEWTAAGQPPFEHVPDLARDVRPRLDALTPALLRALSAAAPALVGPGGRALLEHRSRVLLAGVQGGEAAARAALAPLLDARLLASGEELTVTEEEFRARWMKRCAPGSRFLEKLCSRASRGWQLDGLIDRHLLLAAARRAGLERDPRVVAAQEKDEAMLAALLRDHLGDEPASGTYEDRKAAEQRRAEALAAYLRELRRRAAVRVDAAALDAMVLTP